MMNTSSTIDITMGDNNIPRQLTTIKKENYFVNEQRNIGDMKAIAKEDSFALSFTESDVTNKNIAEQLNDDAESCNSDTSVTDEWTGSDTESKEEEEEEEEEQEIASNNNTNKSISKLKAVLHQKQSSKETILTDKDVIISNPRIGSVIQISKLNLNNVTNKISSPINVNNDKVNAFDQKKNQKNASASNRQQAEAIFSKSNDNVNMNSSKSSGGGGGGSSTPRPSSDHSYESDVPLSMNDLIYSAKTIETVSTPSGASSCIISSRSNMASNRSHGSSAGIDTVTMPKSNVASNSSNVTNNSNIDSALPVTSSRGNATKRSMYSSYKRTNSKDQNNWLQKAKTPRIQTDIIGSSPPEKGTSLYNVNRNSGTFLMQAVDQGDFQHKLLSFSPRELRSQRRQRGLSMPVNSLFNNDKENLISAFEKSEKDSNATHTKSTAQLKQWLTEYRAHQAMNHSLKQHTNVVQYEESQESPKRKRSDSTGSASSHHSHSIPPESNQSTDSSLSDRSETSYTDKSSGSLIKNRIEMVEQPLRMPNAEVIRSTPDTGSFQIENQDLLSSPEIDRYERLKQLYARQCMEKELAEQKLIMLSQQLGRALDSQKKAEQSNREMQQELAKIRSQVQQLQSELEQLNRGCCNIM